MGSPVPYSSLATVNVPQISLIAHLEFPDTYICVYIHVYTHAWSEIAFGGWECLNVDNHSNDNVPNSALMCIICIKRVPRQAFSSSSSVSRNPLYDTKRVQYSNKGGESNVYEYY